MDFTTALFLPYSCTTANDTNNPPRAISKDRCCLEYVVTTTSGSSKPHVSSSSSSSQLPPTSTESTGHHAHTYNNNHKKNKNDSVHHNCRYQLSYHDMIDICFRQHQRFLRDSIWNIMIGIPAEEEEEQHQQQLALLLPQQQQQSPSPSSSSLLLRNSRFVQPQQNVTATTTVTNTTSCVETSSIDISVVVVVAYIISNNNIDYLISILAAMAGNDDDDNSGTSSRVWKHHDNHSKRHRQTQYTILPVLIPTKWTVTEMVHVLQIPSTTATTNNNNNNTSTPKQQQHVTIILHDMHYESIAHQVQQQLLVVELQPQNSTTSSKATTVTTIPPRNIHHIVQCVALPNYAHDWIMRNVVRHASIYTNTCTSHNNNFQDNHHRFYEHRPVVVSYEQVSDATALIVFTSGTGSGISKGVCISHRAMYVQCQMKQSVCSWSDTTKLVFGTTIPMYHIGGIINYFATWYCGGTFILPLLLPVPHRSVASHFLQQPLAQLSFDPRIVFESISSSRLGNALVVVPTMLHAMQIYYEQQPNEQQQQQQYSHVKCILIGGQSANSTVLSFIRHIFPCAQIIQTYACTEATSSLTYHNITATNKNKSITNTTTFPPPAITTTVNNVILSHVEDENGNNRVMQRIGLCVGESPSKQVIELYLWKDQTTGKQIQTSSETAIDSNEEEPIVITTPYTPGIIVSRGPHVMNGYWTLRGRQRQNHNPTTVPSSNDEYLMTNDIGYWSENQQHLYYIGRRSTDTIRTGGETVWCTEVEQVVQQHRQIQECTVFGIPDHSYFGEVVCCAIVTVRGTNITIDQIRLFCAKHGLAGYKRPRHLLVYAQRNNVLLQPPPPPHPSVSASLLLPRNSNGKILKYQLQQKMNELLQKRPDSTKTSTTTSIVYVDTTNPSQDTTRVQSKL